MSCAPSSEGLSSTALLFAMFTSDLHAAGITNRLQAVTSVWHQRTGILVVHVCGLVFSPLGSTKAGFRPWRSRPGIRDPQGSGLCCKAKRHQMGS